MGRSPDWTGLCPALLMVEGLEAVTMTYRRHRLSAIFAVRGNSFTGPMPTKPENPGKNKQNTRGNGLPGKNVGIPLGTPSLKYPTSQGLSRKKAFSQQDDQAVRGQAS